MKTYRLLIIDPDEAFISNFTAHLTRRHEFKIVGTAGTGNRALSLIHSTRPDVILTDLLLPGLDGMSVLKEIQKLKQKPAVICHSEFCSAACLEVARKNGASYFMYKPASFHSLADVLLEYANLADTSRARCVFESVKDEGLEYRFQIHETMRSMGFSMKYSGSLCIAESVALALDSPMILHNMRTGLYPELAALLHISPGSIERNIRTAIAATNTDGHLSALLGSTPTNKSCIQYILRQLNLKR